MLAICVAQKMDPVVRQLDKHIEFEPEWETGFNLQLRLQDVITMFLDWAGSDVSGADERIRVNDDGTKALLVCRKSC